MTLPVSGEITASMINLELGRASDAAFSMNGTAERALAGKPTGAIAMSDFYGKSNYKLGTATTTFVNNGSSGTHTITVSNGQPGAVITYTLYYAESGLPVGGSNTVGTLNASGYITRQYAVEGTDGYWYPAPLSNGFQIYQDTTHLLLETILSS